ncbi:hypothetical protein KJ765_03490 [Candidatus Micrarchaeota archaeon]|nr:hypothetical protein [Candidatus Micrarchaeota archaeon]
MRVSVFLFLVLLGGLITSIETQTLSLDSKDPVPALIVSTNPHTAAPLPRVSVVYVTFTNDKILELEVQVTALRSAGEDVSDIEDLILQGKQLQYVGQGEQADARFREAEVLIFIMKSEVKNGLLSRMFYGVLIAMVVLLLAFTHSWENPVQRFRERLHGPFNHLPAIPKRKKRV